MVLSQNVVLQAILEGRWQLPYGSSIDGRSLEIELFTKNLAGLYEFYTAGLEETEVLAIQIEITAIGKYVALYESLIVSVYELFTPIGGTFAEVKSPEVYNILYGNEVFYTDTTLACATSATSLPQWSYKEVQTDTYIIVSSTTWDSDTGISTLTINIIQQGYYTCTIAGESVYNIAIFNPDITTSELFICFMSIY